MTELLHVLDVMPHRYPFLLLDRVLEVDGDTIRAVKNVTMNEPWVTGHFPGRPVMPGVLLVEAMAQAGGYLIGLGEDDRESKLILFTGIDNCRFRRSVVPGDVVTLEVEIVTRKRNFIKIRGRASVDGETACEADLMSVLTER
jgi:beta-hydroxyacyl-ACP dehydratase FabZ